MRGKKQKTEYNKLMYITTMEYQHLPLTLIEDLSVKLITLSLVSVLQHCGLKSTMTLVAFAFVTSCVFACSLSFTLLH